MKVRPAMRASLLDSEAPVAGSIRWVYNPPVAWPWIVVLVLAAGLVVAAEWSRIGGIVGADARRRREREQRKASLRLIRTDDEEFVASVERDLAQLPTIDERRPTR
jgi:hypothetical protein